MRGESKHSAVGRKVPNEKSFFVLVGHRQVCSHWVAVRVLLTPGPKGPNGRNQVDNMNKSIDDKISAKRLIG